jgi:spore germination cell wall hydrolase CwlJ-like protein
MWPTALALVDEAVGEAWHDPTEGATHYTRSAERTRWTQRLAMTVRIGAHSFYR